MADSPASGLPTGAGVNPNADVGGEGKFESRSNSTPTFGDLDDAEVEQRPPRRRVVTPEKRGEVKDAPQPKTEKKAEAPAKDAKPAKTEAKEGKEVESEEKEDGAPNPDQPKPKPKNHRFKNGEHSGELSGEVVFTVPVDGKKEEVPLQELINNYNGRKKWDVELGKVASDRGKFVKERQDFDKEREDLNSFAAELVKKSAENPDAAVDYLAELTGQDPIELKEKTLRQHIAEILPLARMSEADLENWIREKKLDWRDALHRRRDEQSQQQRLSTEMAQKRQVVQQRFGLDDARYGEIEKNVRDWLKGKDPTPDQVAVASRRIMAVDAMKKAAPHLEKRADIGDILESVFRQLMDSPDITQDQLESLIKDVYPADEEDEETQRPLRGVAQRAARNAEIDDSETPSPERGRSSARQKAQLFSDL